MKELRKEAAVVVSLALVDGGALRLVHNSKVVVLVENGQVLFAWGRRKSSAGRGQTASDVR
jgi:hypothetical protein